MNEINWRKISVVAGAFLTVASAIVAGANAAKVGEPFWVATRGFVSDEMKSLTEKTSNAMVSLEVRQIRTQLFIARSQRQQLENEIASKNVLLQQNANVSQDVRSAIEEQIRNLSRDLESVKEEINKLSAERPRRSGI